MRFEEVAARLHALPSPLPTAYGLLTPHSAAESGNTPDSARPAEDAFRPSAVLVLVFPDEHGAARVLLTARPQAEIRHAGQVSFPGGATDPADADPVATALREAAEEVGLDAASADLEVVGTLDPVTIPVSGFRLVPVLALAPQRPRLTPDPREVSAIFDAPVDRFLPDAAIVPVERTVHDPVGSASVRLRYSAFDYEGFQIWGATARILGQLGAILALDPRG